MIDVCVTNLGKYNEGDLVYNRLSFPATSAEIQKALDDIGIDNIEYEEFFFTDWESEVDGIHDCIGEYSSIREVNALALALDGLDANEIGTLEVILDRESCSTVFEALNIMESLDSFYVRTDIDSEESYGQMLVDENYLGEVPDNLINYIDHEAVGRDWLISNNATIGSNGLIEQIDNINIEYSEYKHLPTQDDIDSELGYDKSEDVEQEDEIEDETETDDWER